uniref:Two-component response regulator-like APRR9 isoform X1 n=1 Tax=Cymbidium ensifolium TaxID=78740 RepID=A0A5J6N9G4_CYMEN|nr:two-component response regulator-like APRR9 isoform X1 [Cymbidium ensifolium]
MGMGEVKKAVGLEAEVEEGGEEVTWEKFLLRAPVRVLLVEGDDSTRQIIAALLRKCGYRVTIASDGLKAWELLREKDHNTDLVLTEVELPKMSGVALLTKMMDEDSCNHIPVIMMSSNDSVSIAFKCMIKGAADFLVKPIRKNELKNLWQHVWRKQKGESRASPNKTVDLNYDLRSIKNETDKQDDMDCCEKESDAQSSCTRSDMEVESTFKLPNSMELNQARHKKFSLFDETISPNIHFEKHSDGMFLFKNDEANGVVSLGSNIQPEEKSNCQVLDQEESSTELIDLIEVINNQPQHISISENSRDNFAENLLVDIELEKNSMPSLELSLDRCPHNTPNRQENDGSNALHHSNSSAFSLYNNNNTVVPKLSQNKGTSNSFTEQSPSQSAANPAHYNGLIPEPDATKLMDATPSCPEGTAFRCTPIRLIPFPIPFGDTGFDCTGSNSFSQSIFYPSSSPPFWGAIPSILQNSFPENHLHQSGFHGIESAQCHNQEACSLRSHGFQAQPWQEEASEQADEQRHVSTVTGDSASVCNDKKYNLNENISTGVSDKNNKPFTTVKICEACARSGDEDGFQKFGEIKAVNKFPLSQREAALTKFRLKRKERCFEKKVRYLSRKKLAEQRPRVKGQFVRQV